MRDRSEPGGMGAIMGLRSAMRELLLLVIRAAEIAHAGFTGAKTEVA